MQLTATQCTPVRFRPAPPSSRHIAMGNLSALYARVMELVDDVQDARSVARGRTPAATIGTSPKDWHGWRTIPNPKKYLPLRPGDGIGRHRRLKISRSQDCTSSSLVPGTTSFGSIACFPNVRIGFGQPRCLNSLYITSRQLFFGVATLHVTKSGQ